jgi:diguanylate cyclase (GGDEF)-like protein
MVTHKKTPQLRRGSPDVSEGRGDVVSMSAGFSLLAQTQTSFRNADHANQNIPNLKVMSVEQIHAVADKMLNNDNTRDDLINLMLAFRAVQRKFSRLEKNFDKLERRLMMTEARLRDAMHTTAEFRQLAQDWEQIATRDALTGINNRYAFMQVLEEFVSRYREHTKVTEKLPDYAIVFIDIDKFKPINDTYGHDVGDEALKALAIRLSEITRSHETFARLSGDEFALLIMGDDSQGDFAAGAKGRLEKGLQGLHIMHEGQRIDIGTSVGVYHVTDHTQEPTALIKRADSDMYEEKRGKGVARAQKELEDRQPAPVDPSQN